MIMADQLQRTDEYYRAMDLAELNNASRKHIIGLEGTYGRW
jgi:hypothetical protein